MKLKEVLTLISSSSLLEEAKSKKDNPNIFKVAKEYEALYEDFSIRGPVVLYGMPLDIAKLLKSKMYSKYGESNLGPNSMKIRTAFKFIGKNSPVIKMSGWDGGIIARDAISALTPKINAYFESIVSGEIDPFAVYDWQGLFMDVKNLLMKNEPFIQERIDRGTNDKLPGSKAILHNGEFGVTLADFVSYIFVNNFKAEYGLKTSEKSRHEYIEQLKAMKVFSLDYLSSLKGDLKNIDPEATDSDSGFRGAYN